MLFFCYFPLKNNSIKGLFSDFLKKTNQKIAISEMAQKEGILLAPEGAAVWMAFKKLVDQQWIEPAEKVVLLNTGSIYKYMENY